jgi:glycosyltransferase involved in cell wall biosynthesis
MDLLKAMVLARNMDDAGLLIIGSSDDDGYERECVEFCRNNGLDKKVFFEGFVHQEEISLYYSISDVLVFPTHRDTWGLVINEAMACGLPVISSDAAGATDDLVANGRNGFTYPSGDIGRLAACIDKILGDDGLRSAMGKESLDIISAFTPKKSAEGFVAAARAVLEGDAG